MGKPELHVHVHIHGAETLTPDVATVHEYAPAATPDGTTAQLNFDAPAAVTDPSPASALEAGEKPVPDRIPITPQLPGDERSQISLTSERNAQLMLLDEAFGKYRSRDSQVKRVDNGQVKMPDDQYRTMKRNRDELLAEAKSHLVKACGACTLKCSIRGNFPQWGRIHKSADTTTPKTESRADWRDRLLKDSEAHCLPPKPSRQTTEADS
jgi:hypothetical protein